MKYVIELPEYIKHEVDIEEDVDKAEDFIKWYSATLTREIKDSTPLQAELEEIKAEIETSRNKALTVDKRLGIDMALGILDNRISELKGENNE